MSYIVYTGWFFKHAHPHFSLEGTIFKNWELRKLRKTGKPGICTKKSAVFEENNFVIFVCNFHIIFILTFQIQDEMFNIFLLFSGLFIDYFQLFNLFTIHMYLLTLKKIETVIGTKFLLGSFSYPNWKYQK